MQARASADEHRDVRRDTSTKSSKLDECYGKIGIRAVAGAAVHCRGDKQKAKSVRRVPKESD